MYFLVEGRPFYQGRLIVGENKPFFQTKVNRQFDSQKVDAAPSFRLRQARLGKYGEGTARLKQRRDCFGRMAAIVGTALSKSSLVL
jgi:hypothetical protein